MIEASRGLQPFGDIDTPIYRIRLMQGLQELVKQEPERFRLYGGKGESFYVTAFSLHALERIKAEFVVEKEIPPDLISLSIEFPPETIVHEVPNEEARAEILAYAMARKDQGRHFYPVYVGRTGEDVTGTFVLDRPGGTRNYRWKWEARARRKRRTFSDLFPKLFEKMTDRDTRFAISLGGGGLLLFAHPSIFKLVEAMGARDSIEEIWGCSGGAIAGMAYSLGADHKLIEQEGYDIYNQRYSFQLSPNKLDVVKNLIKQQLLPGAGISLRGFVDIQTSLQESLGRITRRHKPAIPFYAVAFNVNSQKCDVLTPTKLPKGIYHGTIRRCSPINTVMASAAIPVLFVPKAINFGKTAQMYIDGSLVEEVPVVSIYRKWRTDRDNGITKKKKLFILSVNLFPYLSTQQFFGELLIKHLPMLEMSRILLRLLDLVRMTHIHDDIEFVSHDPNVTVAEVRLPKMSRHNFLNPLIIPTVIDKARGTFYDQLVSIEQKL
jgi:predicted acylesterase/phospholipase RssA